MRLLPNYSNPLHPECVSRNCLKFQLPGGAPGSLTLVDAYSHIEVHPVADAQVLSTLCPTIREGVSKHLEVAKDVLHYSSLHSATGLVCRSKEPHGIAESLPWWKRLFGQSDTTSHPATVSFHGDGAWWACCLTPDKANGNITGRDRLWFPILSHAGEYTNTGNILSFIAYVVVTFRHCVSLNVYSHSLSSPATDSIEKAEQHTPLPVDRGVY